MSVDLFTVTGAIGACVLIFRTLEVTRDGPVSLKPRPASLEVKRFRHVVVMIDRSSCSSFETL